PLDYMESMQQPDGHIRWSRSSDLNGIWMTAYVTPAFAGQVLPIPEATFSAASVPPCDTEGDGAETATGVIAGGGGKGAPLFSRPKPQSKGRTPGGARVVRNEDPRPRNYSRSRRGANEEQPTGTASAEPSEPEPGKSEVLGVGSGKGGALGTQGREVSGVVIGDAGSGDGGELAFGAPGLRSAGADDPEPWVAIGIGAAALLAAMGGARWERRHEEVLP
ncbi:MAG TPA: hypothetical protein VF259_03930, partial [Solirubrobacterales bacterium]